MEIVSKQIPHIFRNRFLRDGDSFMMTTNSGGATGGSSGTFTPHYVWGQYEDGQSDIVGDFTSEANVSIGGDLRVDSSVDIYGNVEIGRNASIGGDLHCNSSANIKGRLSVGGNLITHTVLPSTPTAYNIGSDSSKFGSVYAVRNYVNYVYVSNDVSACDIYPKTTATYNLGSNSLKYLNFYGVNTNSVNVTASNVIVDSVLTAPVISQIQDKLTELENMILDVSARIGS